MVLNLVSQIWTSTFSQSRLKAGTLSTKIMLQAKETSDSLDVLYPEDISMAEARLRERILGDYSARSGGVRQDVVKLLKQSSSDYLNVRGHSETWVSEEEAAMAQSMIAVVDEIFSVIEPYVLELMREFAGTDLNLTLTAPEKVKEAAEFDALRRPVQTLVTYRGRVSTTSLSVVVRGRENRVDFFLMPSDRVIGLSRAEDAREPIMSFVGSRLAEGIDWQVEGKPLTHERLQRYCLLLFKHLLDKTREEPRENRYREYLAS